MNHRSILSRLLFIAIALEIGLPAGPSSAQQEPIEQWALHALGVSSGTQGAGTGRFEALSEPDGPCELPEDSEAGANAWRPNSPDSDMEWLEVGFAAPIHATAIEVYETVNPGAVTGVFVRDLDFELHEVWSGDDPGSGCPAILRIDFDRLPFPTNRVRIELNPSLVPGRNYIDAIKIVGEPIADFQTLFERLGDEARTLPPRFEARASSDYDNDGWPDILTRNTRQPQVEVLHNEGDGTFALRQLYLKATAPAGNGGPLYGDYDNDGDLDLFIPLRTSVRGLGAQFDGKVEGMFSRNLLLRNDRGRFVDVTDEAGVGDEGAWGSAIWFDYDRDGFIDLYVGQWVQPVLSNGIVVEGEETLRNVLYRNNRDGTFSEATAEAGLDLQWHDPGSPFSGGNTAGFIAADFNDDGWTDLYVSVSLSPNRLLINEGGRFRDATTSETGIVAQTLGGAAGDIDHDGDLDLVAAANSGGFVNIEANRESSRLLINLGEGEFLDVTEGVGLQSLIGADSFTARFFDFDNDADLDLMPGFFLPSLFENQGDGTFLERPFQAGLPGALTMADLNDDGFLDTTVRDLYLNKGNANHYLAIDLVGVESNRDGFGTRVFATTGEKRQTRELMSGDSWFQDDLRLHFGLGAHTVVDQLEVRWPSGQVDVINSVPADQTIRIIEGRGEWYPAPRSVWDVPPPKTAAFGETLSLDIVARPTLFEPTATVTRIVGDLSSLGGLAEVPLTDLGDGSYRLQAEFTVGTMNEERDIEVFAEQSTSLGPQWMNLSRNVEVTGAPATAILETFDANLPAAFELDQNFPNPFNNGTVIRFALPEAREVELAVFNLSGQKVATLLQGRREAGQYTVRWDGLEDGRSLASGIYLYRLRDGDQVETRKLLLLR